MLRLIKDFCLVGERDNEFSFVGEEKLSALLMNISGRSMLLDISNPLGVFF